MICEIRNNDNEVVLKNPTFSDVLAILYLWVHKDKEIAFSRPEDQRYDSATDEHP